MSRKLAKKYSKLSLDEIDSLLNSLIHEYRLVALLILVDKYNNDKKNIYDFYFKNVSRVNNWDLVDLTAPKIVGDYLSDKDRNVLYSLAKSPNLWEKRISIVSTFAFIRNNEFSDTLNISEILLNDKHDLIHKAVGWMLREVGKKDEKVLCSFLDKYSKLMPRTMLRYSIEKFSDEKKKYYMRR